MLDKVEVSEWHSGDLSGCARAAYHRHRGEIDGLVESALFTGSLNDELMTRMLTKDGLMDGIPPIEAALKATDQKMKDENRHYSDAVVEHREEIAEEVLTNAIHYQERLGDYFSKCKIIGTQLGMRFEIEHGGDLIHYATTNDALWRSPSGELVNGDWKWKNPAQTVIEMTRHPQPAMMHLAIVEGMVLVDGEWVHFGELPSMWWIDSRNFRPYLRATGEFKKGDVRPLNRLVTEFRLSEDRHDEMRHDLTVRPALARVGLWPRTAGEHCNFCPSLKWCVPFSANTNT